MREPAATGEPVPFQTAAPIGAGLAQAGAERPPLLGGGGMAQGPDHLLFLPGNGPGHLPVGRADAVPFSGVPLPPLGPVPDEAPMKSGGEERSGPVADHGGGASGLAELPQDPAEAGPDEGPAHRGGPHLDAEIEVGEHQASALSPELGPVTLQELLHRFPAGVRSGESTTQSGSDLAAQPAGIALQILVDGDRVPFGTPAPAQGTDLQSEFTTQSDAPFAQAQIVESAPLQPPVGVDAVVSLFISGIRGRFIPRYSVHA